MSAPHAPVRPDDFPGRPAQDGRIAWFLGFLGLLDLLAFLGLPVVGSVTMSLGLLVAGLLQRRNPVARSTGRRAAVLGGMNLAVIAALALLVFVPQAQDVVGEPFQVLIVPLMVIWVFSGGSLFGVCLAVVALLVPVSRTRATRVLARDAARHADQHPHRPSDPPR